MELKALPKFFDHFYDEFKFWFLTFAILRSVFICVKGRPLPFFRKRRKSWNVCSDFSFFTKSISSCCFRRLCEWIVRILVSALFLYLGSYNVHLFYEYNVIAFKKSSLATYSPFSWRSFRFVPVLSRLDGWFSLSRPLLDDD